MADQRKTLRLREAKLAKTKSMSSLKRTAPPPDANVLAALSPDTIKNIKLLVDNVELNVKEVGVYRVPGDSTTVKEIATKAVSSPLTNEDLSNLSSVNVAASAIKMILRNHQPIFPYDYFDTIMRTRFPVDFKKVMSSIGDLYFVNFFLKHIAVVASNEKYNNMGSSQLATCLGVVLFRKDEEPPTDLIKEGERIKRKVEIFKMVLDNLDEILGAVKEDESDKKIAAVEEVNNIVEEYVDEENEAGDSEKVGAEEEGGVLEDDMEMADVTTMSMVGTTVEEAAREAAGEGESKESKGCAKVQGSGKIG